MPSFNVFNYVISSLKSIGKIDIGEQNTQHLEDVDSKLEHLDVVQRSVMARQKLLEIQGTPRGKLNES